MPDVMPDIGPNVLLQEGMVSPLEKESAGIISGSDAFSTAFVTKHCLNARAFHDLIKDALKNSSFPLIAAVFEFST